MITGKTLIEWGYTPGPWFKEALEVLNAAARFGTPEDILKAVAAECAPRPIETASLRDAGCIDFHLNIYPENEIEAENVAAVKRHMTELMRVPTVVAGAVMPDACSASSAAGTIPVGGVVATRNAIHPGMHSEDICCSMAVTMLADDVDPKLVLDTGMKLSHFGGGGRARGRQIMPPSGVLDQFDANPFLAQIRSVAIEHFGTQGDGNHFFFVGYVASTGKLAIVTHHGSRKPGAMLYRAGMQAAQRHTAKVSPETPKHNAWIEADSEMGRDYWAALQAIRAWTKASHYAIHDIVVDAVAGKIAERFWNEHNFVFARNGLYYHAKGATPGFRGYAADDIGLTLVPLNMAEPILITRGLDAANGLGFLPHGAGRNFSRTAYLRSHGDRPHDEIVAEQATSRGIDARWFSGVPDPSELPGAYKPAATVRAQIAQYGLAEIVDTIEPVGSIMAGDWSRDAPWRKRGVK